MNKSIVPLILSGGTGMRLWPISRYFIPKQLISFNNNGNTMLQNTLIRLDNIKNIGESIILCNDNCRLIVANQLKQINKKNYSIIVEPSAKNTAPALTSVLIKITKNDRKNKICLSMPSDHSIANFANFEKTICDGMKYASDGYIVVFGIIPTYPETGYGYIEQGLSVTLTENYKFNKKIKVYFVKKFVEKPSLKIAKTYLTSGNYYWNSGLLMFRADCMLKEIKHFLPETFKTCKLAVNKGIRRGKFFYLNESSFLKCHENSIDKSVLEKTDKSIMIALKDIGWNDLGSWKSIRKNGKKDSKGNVIKGDVLIHNVKNSYIHSKSRLVTAVGLNRHAIVETSDAILVAPLEKSQDVKYIVNQLKQANRKEAFSHTINYYHWGSKKILLISDIIKLNLVNVNPGKFFHVSQYFGSQGKWMVVDGKAVFKLNNLKFYLKKKESIKINDSSNCYFLNPNKNKTTLKLLEFNLDNLI